MERQEAGGDLASSGGEEPGSAARRREPLCGAVVSLGSWVSRADTKTPRFLGFDCAASGHRVKAAPSGRRKRWLRQP